MRPSAALFQASQSCPTLNDTCISHLQLCRHLPPALMATDRGEAAGEEENVTHVGAGARAYFVCLHHRREREGGRRGQR